MTETTTMPVFNKNASIDTVTIPPGCIDSNSRPISAGTIFSNQATTEMLSTSTTQATFTRSTRPASQMSNLNSRYTMVHSRSQPPNVPLSKAANYKIVLRSPSAHQVRSARDPATITSSDKRPSTTTRVGQVTTIDEARTTNSIVRPIRATVIGNGTPQVDAIDESTVIQAEADWAASLNRMAQNQKRTYSVASSGSSLGGDICRICHCEATHESPLLTPCHCSGSLRYVHQHCLQQWIKTSQTKSCEVCRYNFIMQSKLKPLWRWQHLDLNKHEVHRLLCSVSFHLIALSCVIWSEYVLTERLISDYNEDNFTWEFWVKLFVAIVGLLGGVTFWFFQCRQYCQLCSRWKNYNKIVFVQNCPDVKPPPPPPPKLQNKGKSFKSTSKARIAIA